MGNRVSDRAGYQRALAAQRLDRQRNTETPDPRRITAALDLAGLYGPDVDRALGGEEPMVDRWESGELVPTRAQVDALAELTGQPVGFFYQPHRELAVWACGKDGCHRVETRPDPRTQPEPVAPVIPLGGPRR